MAWRPDRWLWGLPVVVVIWVAATWLAVPRVEGDIRRSVQEAAGMAALRRIGARVEVRGLDVVIVADFDIPDPVRAEAELAAASITGVRRVRVEIAKAFTIEPFRLTIRRRASGMQLEGGVPPGALHARLVERALSIATADKLEDKLMPALGAPPAFGEAAEAALNLASHLTRGEVTLTDRQLRAEGDAADFDAYNAIVAGLNALPLGYSVGPVDIVPPDIRPFTWSAARDGDVVTLSGYVPSERAREMVRAAAEAEMPGVSLMDRTQTARGLDRGVDFEGMARVAFAALSRLQRGRAEFETRRLELTGNVVARDLLDVLADQVRKGLPSGVRPGAITLTPVPAAPYVFAARRAAGRVTLSGFSPGPAERGAVQSAAARRFPGEAILDDLHIADGSPEGFAAATALSLDALSELADGEVRIVGRTVTLVGRALYREMAERTRQRVAKGLPAGWTGAAEIRAEPFEKPLEPGLCGDLLADLTRREPIRFEAGRAELAAKSRPLLDAAAGIVKRCGSARIRVIAHIETPGDPDAARELARERAQGIAAALSGHRAQLSAEGTSSRAETTPGKGEPEHLAFSVEP